MQGTDTCNQVINELAGNLLSLSSPPALSLNSSALESLKSGQYLPVVVYNTLGWTRSDFVSILTKRVDVIVVDDKGNPIPSQINPIGDFSLDSGTFTQRLFFQPHVPAYGTRTYFITVDRARAVVGVVSKGSTNITNNFYRLSFDPASGRWASLTNIVTGVSRQVNHEYYEYVSASQVCFVEL